MQPPPQTIRELHKKVATVLIDLLRLIRTKLSLMREEAFCFYPEDGDPAGGWRDLHHFAAAYNLLPEFIRDGDYFLYIALPENIPIHPDIQALLPI